MSGTWFLDDLQRLRVERAAVDELERTSGWLSNIHWFLKGACLALDATLTAYGRPYQIRLTYPEFFPAIPPVVKPQKGSEHWSDHQYVGGTLCLEWGPDNWEPAVTGAMMLESAFRLLSTEASENPDGGRPAPSRHELTTGQELRDRYSRVLIGHELLEQLRKIPKGEIRLAKFAVHYRPHTALTVIHSLHSDAGEVWENPDLPRPFQTGESLVLEREAYVVSYVRVESSDRPISTRAELNEFLSACGYPTVENDGRGVLAVDSAGGVRFFRRFDGEEETVLECARVLLPAKGPERLAPEYLALKDTSVGIVGLGSLGSKVAESLARTGIGRFYLVDDDVFLPENVVRHALDLRSVADHKAVAVAELIEASSPHASVQYSEFRLGGQESNSVLSGELSRLTKCSLMIDATADPTVFNLLASAAVTKETPLAWGAVFAGGIGGVVARSRPGVDPSPFVVRRCLAAYSADHPAPDTPAIDPYAAKEPAGDVHIATDADVSVIAAILTELVLDVLLARQPARFPHSLYLVGLARAWIFSAPLHVIPLEVGEATREKDEDVALDQETVKEGAAFVEQLINEVRNAHHPTE